jgi:fused signal recognition particle receptor
VPVPTEISEKTSWAKRLRAGLARTRVALGGGLGNLLVGHRIDESLFEDLESALLMADCGVEATSLLVGQLRDRARRERFETGEALKAVLTDLLLELVAPLERPFDVGRPKPCVVMIAGVNGSGKTTSIGKLAKWLQGQGKSVLLAAGDTFRAAAREQLVAWGERNRVAVIAQESGDPGAVVHDAICAAQARGIDVVLADTAGRLPTQLHLMEEIKKVKRVVAKLLPDGPHEVLLVLDANTGQNGLAQVKAFDKALGVTGLILTKLDGTAKGGVVCAIALARSTSALARSTSALARSTPALARSDSARKILPIYFVGVGEGIDDLRPFSARDFVEAIVD